jgi:hypothetical protein
MKFGRQLGTVRSRIVIAGIAALTFVTGAAVVIPQMAKADPSKTVILNPQDPADHNVHVSEGLSGTPTVTVNFVLSEDNAHAVTVSYTTQDGKVLPDGTTDPDVPPATAGSDYISRTNSVTFAAHTGTTPKGVDFSIKGDQAFEPNEVFSVVVTDVATSDGFAKGSNGFVTIDNDDSPPNVFLDDPQPVPETNSGTTTMEFPLRLSAPLGQDDHVLVTTQIARVIPPSQPGGQPTTPPRATGGDADAIDPLHTDYINKTNEDFTLKAGTTLFKVPVTIVGDVRDENNEKFELQLSQAPGSALDPHDYGTGTITDDDAPPVLDVSDAFVSEGPLDSAHCTEGTPANGDEDFSQCHQVKFTVTLTPPSDKVVHVDFATDDRSAVAGDDYESTSGSFDDTPPPLTNDTALYFQPGEVSHDVFVDVLGDNTPEPAERFAFDRSNPSNATLGHGEAFGVINNDDGGTFPTVKVANANPATVSESTANASFTFTANWPATTPPTPGQPIEVFYTTADGPENSNCGIARAGSDYTATSGSFTLNWGLTNTASQTVTVPINNDALHEGTECFQMQISDASNAAVTDAVGEATITDDDAAPKVSVDATTTVVEGTGTTATVAHIGVTLDKASGDPVTVNYSTPQPNGAPDPKAQPGADKDYGNTQGNVVFAPGEKTKTFDVNIVADSMDEPDENFDVAITSTDATVDKGAGVVTITDDDDPPVVSIASNKATEGDTGTANATLEVSLSAPSGKQVTVTATTADGTAKQPGDYTSTTKTLTFDPGGPTDQGFQVPVVGDTIDEADETFTATLSAPTNATIAASPNNTGTLTINDDDGGPSFGIDDVTVTEGNTGTTNATFTVTKTGATTQTVGVHFATADGTATQPGDYTSTSGDLSFAPNDTTKQVVVPVKGDTTDESNETFTVKLTAPTNGATVSDDTGTGTITDDDNPPGAPLVGVGGATATEGDPATFTFTLSKASDTDVTVNYSTADGTAKAATDYTAVPAGVATIKAGDLTTTANVATTEDTTHEPQETFTLTINSANGANVDPAFKTGTGTINDDDAAVTKGQVTTGAGPGGGPHIQSFESYKDDPPAVASFMDGAEATGKRVARGDVDGDGIDEIITGSGPGSPSVISVYSSTGQLKASSFAYAGGRFYGGVFVAAGDVDGDGKDEVISGAGPGGGPHVIVWKVTGQSLTPVDGGFMAYNNWSGGVTVAAGDVTGDGKADIITGPGAGGGPDVEVWNGPNRARLFGFMAYTDPQAQPNWNGGVNVASGDLDGDGKAEIVVGPWNGGGPHLRIFEHDGKLRNGGVFAGNPSFSGGLTVAVGDLNGDGKAEIIVGAFSQTNAVKGYTNQTPENLAPIGSVDFKPYGNFGGGNFVAVGKA